MLFTGITILIFEPVKDKKAYRPGYHSDYLFLCFPVRHVLSSGHPIPQRDPDLKEAPMTEILGYIATAFSPGNLIFALVGTILGIIVGALPGFTPTMGIAVLIPVTYTIDSTTALVFLGAIYCGSMFGGSISAILINTPGTSAAAATAMDGYAMTLKGKSHEALVESAMSSFWGGILSVVALLFLAPPLARFAFQFGPQERFMMVSLV